MALISVLSSPNPACHHLFQSAPPSGPDVTSTLAGHSDSFSYRLNGPDHIPRALGETAEFIWMTEGAQATTPEHINRLMLSWSAGDLLQPSEISRFYQKLSACFHHGFVAAIVAKRNGGAIVLNDRLGRLPLYLAIKGDAIMVSRQIFHIHQTLERLTPDGPGTAFHLMFGFSAAGNTLWKEVQRIGPGCAVIVHQHEVTIQRIDDGLNFTPDADSPTNDLIGQTAALLDEATSASWKPETILSMSGGLDSRLLAASLQKQRLPFRMVSYADASGSAANDIRCAHEMARIIGQPLEIVNLDNAGVHHLDELQELKHGLNYSGMAFLIAFLEQFPPTARVFTGDGGDKLLAPTGKIPPLRNIHQLAGHIIDRHALMSPATAAILTGTDQSGLIRTLETDLNAIFEKDLQHTYSLFLLRRRAFKWLFEGEDRNRWYVDHAAPIWHLPLASFLLRVPAAEKEGYNLFRKVLMHYNPELAAVSNANWGFPVTAQRRVKQLLFRQKYKFSWPVAQIIGLRKSLMPRQNQHHVPPELQEWYKAWSRKRQSAPPLLTAENMFYLYSLQREGLIE